MSGTVPQPRRTEIRQINKVPTCYNHQPSEGGGKEKSRKSAIIKADFYLPPSMGHVIFQVLSVPFLMSSSQQPYGMGSMIMPILQMGKLKPRGLK